MPIGADAIASRWIIGVGIDPGSITGMIAVAVERDRPDVAKGRLVGEAIIRVGAYGVLDESLHLRKRIGSLGNGVFKQLRAWNVGSMPSIIVIENPTEAMPVWGQNQPGTDPRTVLDLARGVGKPKRRIMGASRGTIANLGVHLGIVATAASVVAPSAELHAYHVTSRKDAKRRRGHVGWMRGMSRARVLDEMGYLLRTLRARPHSGILPTRDAIFESPDENVLMALGVLNFHFQRQRE